MLVVVGISVEFMGGATLGGCLLGDVVGTGAAGTNAHELFSLLLAAANAAVVVA